MNRQTGRHILRFILFILVQVLILKRIQIGGSDFHYIHLFFSPLALLLLPFNTPRLLVLGVGFASGIILDIFYDSPGVHAAASVLLAYLRTYLFLWLEPRGGYSVNTSPTLRAMGSNWFFTYSAIGLAIYLLSYYSFQAFTLVYIVSILLKTVFSFVFSMILIAVYMFVINPSE